MANIIVGCAKYMMIFLIAIYAYQCFAVFAYTDERAKKRILLYQNVIMFLIHFMAFMGMYFKTGEIKILLFYLAQFVLLFLILLGYNKCYPKISKLIVNNMCMLLIIGFIMITRLSYQKAVKQYVIAAGAFLISLIIPIVLKKVKIFPKLRIIYAVVGMVSLGLVFIAGSVSYGAKLGFTIAGIGVQPSEFVKIIFVFFVAASLQESTTFKNVVATTVVAAIHVLILVISKDLGAALIIFIVYLVMLYVATKQPLYTVAGIGAGSGAAVVAYHLFDHVKTRVTVWKDPLAVYQKGGMQVSQSLFAIGTGSWLGTGLFQGKANKIPVADEDFIFSAISEEMGLVFGLCMILICISCYVMFLNIAMRLEKKFYKLVALGLGTYYIFQTFLNIGGVTNFIPSTGVTLPLVSYGGSSVFSTLIMFAIIQGLYILKEEEDSNLEKKRQSRETQIPRARRDRDYLVDERGERSSQEDARRKRAQKATQEKQNRKSRIR